MHSLDSEHTLWMPLD